MIELVNSLPQAPQ